MSRSKFSPKQIRLAVIGGVAVVIAGAAGATAALATSAGRSTVGGSEPAFASGRLLTLRTLAPPPITMPGPADGAEPLAVLADAPADLIVDPSLESARDLAMIRQADAVKAHDAQVQAMLWAREEARMQAQIDAAMRPSNVAMDSDAGDPAGPAAARAGDPEITASAGDTRRPRVSAD